MSTCQAHVLLFTGAKAQPVGQWLTSEDVLGDFPLKRFQLPELIVSRRQQVLTEEAADKSRKCCDTLLTRRTPLVGLRGRSSAQAWLLPAATAFGGFHCLSRLLGDMSSISVPPPKCLQKPLVVPHRHMFGPGPSNVSPRILQAGARPVIGHMHPEIFEVMKGD